MEPTPSVAPYTTLLLFYCDQYAYNCGLTYNNRHLRLYFYIKGRGCHDKRLIKWNKVLRFKYRSGITYLTIRRIDDFWEEATKFTHVAVVFRQLVDEQTLGVKRDRLGRTSGRLRNRLQPVRDDDVASAYFLFVEDMACLVLVSLNSLSTTIIKLECFSRARIFSF
jgi:hypothetical protein